MSLKFIKQLEKNLNLDTQIIHNIKKKYLKKLHTIDAIEKHKIICDLKHYSWNKTSRFTDVICFESDIKNSHLTEILCQLKPWRKGPFKINSTFLKTEWRSDKKWNRIKHLATQFKNKKILDIGASSGYYSIKAMEYDPSFILAIDPYITYYYQFQLLNHNNLFDRICYLPIGIQDLRDISSCFDIILNMGILYHQANPIDFLKHCFKLLNKNGIMLLETIIWPSNQSISFTPPDRYAGMKNIYHIPSRLCLENWCKKIGFKNINCLNITKTSLYEQHQTEWILGHSLNQFLDSKNKNNTLEGYPRPVRAVIYMQK